MLEATEKICTKCKQSKLIKEFGKRGQKLQPSCKICVNKYQRDRHKNKKKKKENERGKLLQNPEENRTPIFGRKPVTGPETVKRKQMMLLEGEAYRYIKITCPCGLSIDTEYHHSYDEKNDYYEATCPVCGKIFKQTITSK